MSGYTTGSSALALRQCTECQEWLNPDELVSIVGYQVCSDCLGDFLQKDATVRDYCAEFLAGYEADFLEWLFQGGEYSPGRLLQDNSFLSKADKLRWLRLGWEDWKKFHPQEAAEAQREFIKSTPGEWEDYLKGLQNHETV